MKCTILKRYLSAMLVMAASVSLLHADYHSDSMQSTNQTTTEKNQQTPDIADALKAAGPKVSNGADIFISADYIFWNANTGSSILAIEALDNTPLVGPTPVNTALANQRTFQMMDRWSSGFKVALGLNLAYDDWFTFVEYTWLRPTQTQQATAQPLMAITSIQDIAGMSASTQAGGRWEARSDLHFNVIDWKIGRDAYFGKHLTISPYAGLKGTWQKFTINQTLQNTTFNGIVTFTGPIRTFLENRYGGIGVLSGLKLQMFLTEGFYIKSQLECTGMWSKLTITDQATADALATTWRAVNRENSVYPINFIADFFLGLGYQKYFSNNEYALSISAGWEAQIWMNWINISQLTNTNLTLQGLDLKVRFDF